MHSSDSRCVWGNRVGRRCMLGVGAERLSLLAAILSVKSVAHLRFMLKVTSPPMPSNGLPPRSSSSLPLAARSASSLACHRSHEGVRMERCTTRRL